MEQGRSIRQAALIADLSDAYWGQVEKGYVQAKGEQRPVRPSRRALLAIADSLRMSSKATSALLSSAGHKAYVAGESETPRESEVDLTGLSRRDVALLNALADRFRESAAEAPTQTRPLRAVASGRRGPTKSAQSEASTKAAKARRDQGQ